jgi:squalene-hopene/tetraprenyl-beta-curcumene cyclase
MVARAEEAPRGEEPWRTEARTTVEKGLNWLTAQQRPNGSWSNEKYPALTGLPVWAFARSEHPRRADAIAKARPFLLAHAREDGGIYRGSLLTGGLSTYNTAICMTALHALNDPALSPVILRARKFIASSQYLGSDEYRGGFGYSQDTFILHADMQNTVSALQAMRLTAAVEDLRPSSEPRVDIRWDEAVRFIERLQNGAAAGPDQAGGFAYKPGKSTAGATTNRQGTVVLRATGSMTYSGLLSLIYAEVDREDPRVRSAVDWAQRHWALDENPGMGDSGRYFFYNVMTRALAAFGTPALRREGATDVDWRREAARVIVSLQKNGETAGEGYWVNEGSSRFWEGDAVLVTSYSVLALETVLGR